MQLLITIQRVETLDTVIGYLVPMGRLEGEVLIEVLID